MCFDNILIKSPNEIICHASALMISSVGLSKRELQPAGLDSRRCKAAGLGSECNVGCSCCRSSGRG
jgi:hypothetical protein